MDIEECIEAIKELKEKGWSVRDLALEIGVTYKTLYNWINGTAEPRGLQLFALQVFVGGVHATNKDLV